jgi:hypothetical protein
MKLGRKAMAMGLGAMGIGIIAGGSAFTDANTVPASKAGIGSEAISGYTATAIHYGLDTDPSKIAEVTMTVDALVATGSTAKVQLETSGTWYACSWVNGVSTSALTCDTSGGTLPLVVDATNLSLVIAQ